MIDISSVFDGGGDALTLSLTPLAGVSLGMDNKLTFEHDGNLAVGTHTITISAADSNSETASSTFMYTLQVTPSNGDDTVNGFSFLGAITLDMLAGVDRLTNNTFLGVSDEILNHTLATGAGNDVLASNTFSAAKSVATITLDGGDDNDTFTDNHFESTGLAVTDVVNNITLMGGMGDDTFTNNSAIQANGALASVTIDGGNGNDKVFFALASTMFTITGSGANITVTDSMPSADSNAEYVLLDIEELYFEGNLYT